MIAMLKNRWLWVGAIWAGAVLTAVWNHQLVDSILSIQSQNQALRRELVFQQQNARKLDRIQEEHSKLFFSAESVQLGMLAVKSILGELAFRFDLNLAQLAVTPPQRGAETVSLNLSFSGALDRIIPFLAALNTHRHLLTKKISIKIDPKSADGSCELSMTLRCRVPSAAEIPSVPGESRMNSAL
jgi:hypothetical protein